MTAEWYRTCFDDSYIELDRLRYPPSLNEAQAAGIARLLGMRRNGRWLDVCCGYGRHLLPLLARGYEVTGIDLSSVMLRALESDAQQRGLSPKAIRTDIRKIPFTDHFTGAYLVGSSFGVFSDPMDDLKALRSIHRSLRPGGRLLIDQANPKVAFPAPTPSRKTYQLQSQQVEEEVTQEEGRNRLVLQRTLRRGSWTKQWVMVFRTYDATSLTEIVEKAGFTPTARYGDLEGNPYTEDSSRVVLVSACKK